MKYFVVTSLRGAPGFSACAWKRAPWVLMAAMAVLAGCRPDDVQEVADAPSPRGEVVATIGETVILRDEISTEVERRRARGQAADAPGVLDELILRESLLARARALRLDEDPAMILAWKRLLIAELKRRELEPLIEAASVAAAADAATGGTVEHAKSSGRTVHQVRLAIVKQSVHSRSSEAAHERARRKLIEAREETMALPAGETSFGAVAVTYSDDTSTRYQGGDMGWLTESKAGLPLDPPLTEAVVALRHPGDVSPVVRGADGYYLIRLMERRSVALPGTRTAGAGPGTARAAVEREFEDRIRSAVPVSINAERLRDLESGDHGAAIPGVERVFAEGGSVP